MAKEKFVSIKEAASAAGLDEEILRKEIEEGSLKGEKKNGWFFDEWFVHSSEIDGLKARRKNRLRGNHASAIEKLQTARLLDGERNSDRAGAGNDSDTEFGALKSPALSSLLEIDVDTSKDSADWRQEYKDVTKRVAEEFMRPLMERLELQAAALSEKDAIIEAQRQQLLLLPDYEKREESARLALATKEKQLDLFESKLDLLEIKFVAETANLKSHIANTERLVVAKEAEAAALVVELSEREKQKAALLEQMAGLEAVVTELRRPFWKKLFH